MAITCRAIRRVLGKQWLRRIINIRMNVQSNIKLIELQVVTDVFDRLHSESSMNPTAAHPADSPRAEARRAQIRAAAADCFRQHGFHGTSIAQISKAASMSTGHIYHYFENKEAIIAEIVAQDLERALGVNAELRAASDLKAATIERAVVEGVEDNLDPGLAGLQLEIVAEAARNPHIAGIVQAADRQCRDSITETLRALRQAAGYQDSESALAVLVEALSAMFEGLRVRAIRNPGIDRAGLARMFQRMVGDLLTQPSL